MSNSFLATLNSRGIKNGVFSFLLVLLLMPLGHIIMVLNENMLHGSKYYGAVAMGLVGLVMVFWGIKRSKQLVFATIMGFLGGVLIWTGWIEFSFMWIVEKNNVMHLMVNGEIATKREYLVMLSSIGLLVTCTLFYLFSRTSCTFYNWIQDRLGIRSDVSPEGQNFRKPVAVTTFVETIMLLWFFYIVLLVVYDEQIAGDNHLATHFVAWGSLLWSVYLFAKLITKQVFDYAIRYAIPTVIIFWTFVEILGRWSLFKEIWIYPVEHWVESLLMFIALLVLVTLFLKSPYFKRRRTS